MIRVVTYISLMGQTESLLTLMADERFASVSGTRSLNSPLARSTMTSLHLVGKGGGDCLQVIFCIVTIDQFVPIDMLEVVGIIFCNTKHVFLHYDHQKTGYPQEEELTLALSL